MPTSSHQSCSSWCECWERDKVADDAHRPRVDIATGSVQYGLGPFLFLAESDGPQLVKAVLNCWDKQSGAVFAAIAVKEGDPYALAVAIEAIKFISTLLMIVCDPEHSAKKILEKA